MTNFETWLAAQLLLRDECGMGHCKRFRETEWGPAADGKEGSASLSGRTMTVAVTVAVSKSPLIASHRPRPQLSGPPDTFAKMSCFDVYECMIHALTVLIPAIAPCNKVFDK